MRLTAKYHELKELIDVVLDDEATAEQLDKLQAILKNNPEAQRFYYDYIGMHMHLKSAADPNIEFVYRRMSEEFIVRPIDKINRRENIINSSSAYIGAQAAVINKAKAIVKDDLPTNKPLKLSKIILTILSLFVVLLLIAKFATDADRTLFTAKILQGELSIAELGTIESDVLSPGEYRVIKPAQLQLNDGDILHLVANSVIKIFNHNEIQLIRGALKIEPVSDHNILVHVQNFEIYTNGSELYIDLTANQPVIRSGIGTLLNPKIWRPRHYWAFDDLGQLTMDTAGRADGTVSPAAQRIKGLIGQGAFLFNNTEFARINVGNGGGIAPASGSFSVRDGVTIEALIVPNYSGLPEDDDHIFRKDQTDGNLRMLLSFQNDKGKEYLRPKGEFDESISFGLFLLGQNYQELKLPLDGQEGRPTLDELKDGKPHHLVATYDATTGYKAIYLDGKKRASFRYPVGSKILSGGQGMAHIGNNPNDTFNENEAFDGIIDELAFYDYALPPFMIEHHFTQINNGFNYFGLRPNSKPLPENIKVRLPDQTKIEIDAATGLPYQIIKNN